MPLIENRKLRSQIISISLLKDLIDTTQIPLSIINAFSNVTGEEVRSKNQESSYIPTVNSQREKIEKISPRTWIQFPICISSHS